MQLNHVKAITFLIAALPCASCPAPAKPVYPLQSIPTYDAWNRLAGIYEPGTWDFDTNGDLVGAPGPYIEQFQYDALGRRVLTKAQTAPRFTEHVYGTGAAVLEEYTGPGTAQTLARWFIHGESFPDPLYMVDRTSAGDLGAGVSEWLYYLKDALGGVMALVSLDTGEVVERYAYDPYGKTEVLVYFQVEYPGGPMAPSGGYFYHDQDFDGDVDVLDELDLTDCMGSQSPRCVFFHDRNDDGRVDALDGLLMETVYGGAGENGEAPSAGHARSAPEAELGEAAAEVAAVAEVGSLQACLSTSDPWCLALYDADTSGVVDGVDVAAIDKAHLLDEVEEEGEGEGDGEGDNFEFGGNSLGNEIEPLQSRYRNPFLWTGQRYDAMTGVYHFTARAYLPGIGRFLQRDPMGALSSGVPFAGLLPAGSAMPIANVRFAAGQEYMESGNLFAYADTNPITRTDRLGLFFNDEDTEGTLLVTRDWDRIYDSITGNGRAYLGVQGAATWGSFWGGNVTALPDFANGMAGVSQGMSDFADYYAESVILLPVEGALAGIGNFGSYAAVGQASSKGSRFAAIAPIVLLRRMHNHHPLPRFLAGHFRQFLSRIPDVVHRRLHSVLNRTLQNRGLPLPVGGRRGSTDAWRTYLENNSGSQRRAFDAILDAARIVDETEGTHLGQDVWRNIMNGAFDAL